VQETTAKLISLTRLAWLGLGVATLFAAPAWSQVDHSAHRAMADAPGHVGMSSSEGIVVDFDLVDRDGKPMTDEDFRGRYVLLGFGFTHCEHICPLMGLHMGQVVDAASVPTTGIFVSVDTERDNAATSDAYAKHFADSMVGLGGSIEQINAAAKNFKVSYAVTKTQDAYTVQHTANIFLIDPHGQLAEVFAFTASADEILAAIH